MSHSLVLALFPSPAAATAAAHALHSEGIGRESLSVVARSHDEQGALATRLDATPGAEIEDSRAAARLGELGATVIAAAASVMPGMAPLLAVGPLTAEFGEAAGHVAGGIGTVLGRAGLSTDAASAWEAQVEGGAVLLGVHVPPAQIGMVEQTVRRAGAAEVAVAPWPGEAS